MEDMQTETLSNYDYEGKEKMHHLEDADISSNIDESSESCNTRENSVTFNDCTGQGIDNTAIKRNAQCTERVDGEIKTEIEYKKRNGNSEENSPKKNRRTIEDSDEEYGGPFPGFEMRDRTNPRKKRKKEDKENENSLDVQHPESKEQNTDIIPEEKIDSSLKVEDKSDKEQNTDIIPEEKTDSSLKVDDKTEQENEPTKSETSDKEVNDDTPKINEQKGDANNSNTPDEKKVIEDEMDTSEVEKNEEKDMIKIRTEDVSKSDASDGKDEGKSEMETEIKIKPPAEENKEEETKINDTMVDKETEENKTEEMCEETKKDDVEANKETEETKTTEETPEEIKKDDTEANIETEDTKKIEEIRDETKKDDARAENVIEEPKAEGKPEETQKSDARSENVTEEPKAEEKPEETQKPEASVDEKPKDDDVVKTPLLRETLLKARPSTENREELSKENKDDEAVDNNDDHDFDDDDDFDPSLLCPDISMDVDEAPVITNNDPVPHDGSTSPLLFDPVFSTYVDEMTGAEVSFNLTAEEHNLRQRLYGPTNPIQYNRIHCTACNVHLGSALNGQKNRFVHPLMKVLICKDCYHFYTSGEFEKDEDGSELYCRWCGQGGQVLCCSTCEFVFCKKCIRNNFGRKKLAEVRDSEEWRCFRCDPIQLATLRVMCVEFFEYVRREMARASTLNDPSFLTTDHSPCCQPTVKKKPAPPEEVEGAPVEKKKRKRGKHEDPDYNPADDIVVDPSKPSTSGVKPPTPVPSTSGVKSPAATPPPAVPGTSKQPVPILPKPNETKTPQPGPIIKPLNSKVPNVGYRIIPPTNPPPPGQLGYTPRPRMQQANINRPGVRQSSPGYIRVLPPPLRQITPTRPVATSPYQTRPRLPNSQPTMKHEWFEKTVRAAARVNSNLSYTLTQLNRAQAQASSVEALAVVHNKLQEILSTSINSLIQIRKNLRTEFIAGIKTIRFPPKESETQPKPPPLSKATPASNDDDVIFVDHTESLPPPPPLTPVPVVVPPVVPLSPAVSLTPIKRTEPATTSGSKASTPKSNAEEKPRIYLKVKSFTALQNVTAECITIPDDPPDLTPIQDKDPLAEDTITVPGCDQSKEVDPLIITNGLTSNIRIANVTSVIEEAEETPKAKEDSSDKNGSAKKDESKIADVPNEKERSVEKNQQDHNVNEKNNSHERMNDAGQKDNASKKDNPKEGDNRKENDNPGEMDSRNEKDNPEKRDNLKENDIPEEMETRNESDTSVVEVQDSADEKDEPKEAEGNKGQGPITFNLKHGLPKDFRRFQGVQVLIKRSDEIDRLMKVKSEVVNGEISE